MQLYSHKNDRASNTTVMYLFLISTVTTIFLLITKAGASVFAATYAALAACQVQAVLQI